MLGSILWTMFTGEPGEMWFPEPLPKNERIALNVKNKIYKTFYISVEIDLMFLGDQVLIKVLKKDSRKSLHFKIDNPPIKMEEIEDAIFKEIEKWLEER
jgi:hypothetical protein